MSGRIVPPLALLAVIATACRKQQSILAPRGPAAERIAELGGAVLVAFCIVALVMFVLILWVALRRRGTLAEHEPPDVGGGESWIFLGGFGIPTLILAVIFVGTLRAMSYFPLHSSRPSEHGPDIIVTAHQWWWQAEYVGQDLTYADAGEGLNLDRRVTTANELHIPVGFPVDIALQSADVIHSFWVPQLHGKVDVVPGQVNRIRITAWDKGRFRGQCGEYCGQQHAHMILYITAESPDDFQKWMAAQRKPGAEPATAEQAEGRKLFLTKACVLCHTVRGTGANATVGPDLTHIASRPTIAAGTAPNSTAYLEAWVTHAQSIKPGAQMPDLTEFDGRQIQALVAYLQNLK